MRPSKLDVYNEIASSPYSLEVKRAVLAVYNSGYVQHDCKSVIELVQYLEDFVIKGGVFIGGRSEVGDFYVYDVDDFAHSFWMALIGDAEPQKSFYKKVIEHYHIASQKIENA